MTTKQSLTWWQLFYREVRVLAAVEQKEDPVLKAARIAQLEEKPEEWFRYYFKKYTYAPAAEFHKNATERVLSNREWYEVRMWSRELAKSTRTMMEVLYLVLVGHKSNETSGKRLRKKYVLLISNSVENATRLLAPYRNALAANRRIIHDYGVQESVGSWQAGEFMTRQGVAFRALGAGQSPRGTRNEEARPDIILFDDVDTDAECLNPEIIARKWRWIDEAAIGTRSISVPTTIIFCGNRIAADCCIERACRLADHIDEVNIRGKDGLSSWPEKNTEVDIDRVLKQKSYVAAQKEYFNNPLTEGSVFKEMAYKPARPMSEYEKLVCYTDPSYKDTNDYKATVLVGYWQNEFHIIKCYLEQATTAHLIGWHYSIMNLVGGCACSYFIEASFMQDVIVKEVSDAGMRTGRAIPVNRDVRKKPDKFTRIEALLEPLYRNGQLYLNEAERHNPHMERLAEQFAAFAPGSRAHDDGPDAVEGAVWIMNEKMAKRKEPVVYMMPRPANPHRF